MSRIDSDIFSYGLVESIRLTAAGDAINKIKEGGAVVNKHLELLCRYSNSPSKDLETSLESIYGDYWQNVYNEWLLSGFDVNMIFRYAQSLNCTDLLYVCISREIVMVYQAKKTECLFPRPPVDAWKCLSDNGIQSYFTKGNLLGYTTVMSAIVCATTFITQE